MLTEGIKFVRPPKTADYGTVAVFEDLYGNWWDLIGPASGERTEAREGEKREHRRDAESAENAE
jgi:hypothetical protein